MFKWVIVAVIGILILLTVVNSIWPSLRLAREHATTRHPDSSPVAAEASVPLEA